MDDRVDRSAPTGDIRCGTKAGYAAHSTRGEYACADCRAANSAYAKQRRAELRDGTARLRQPAQCGTPAGYQKHLRIGEATCSSCKRAILLEAQRKRASKPGHHARISRRSNWRSQGIDPDEAEAALAVHNGFCDICGRTSPGRRSWHIDHDHVTGAVRGVLCSPCNQGLGMFKDDAATVEKAFEYLRRHKAKMMSRTFGTV